MVNSSQFNDDDCLHLCNAVIYEMTVMKTFCSVLVCDVELLWIDEAATIRVTNLSEDTREADLQDLFRPFGAIQRIYLAKDKNTGQSKVVL